MDSKQLVDVAAEVMEQARTKLIEEGVIPEVADQRVIANFDRIRQNPSRLTLNVQTLCDEL